MATGGSSAAPRHPSKEEDRQTDRQTRETPSVGTNTLAPGGGDGAGRYTYVSHGGKPVISSAVVHFTKKDLNTGSEPDAADKEYVRELGGDDGDDAGHIYANQLGGLAEPINLFPQSPHVNRGAYRSFETKIYNCMKTGGASSATPPPSASCDAISCAAAAWPCSAAKARIAASRAAVAAALGASAVPSRAIRASTWPAVSGTCSASSASRSPTERPGSS